MIGVGFGLSEKVEKAVKKAVEQALSGQSAQSADLAVCFAGGRHKAPAVFDALRQALPDVPIVGGSAVGCVGNSRLGYSGYELTLTVLPKSLGPFQVCRVNGLDRGEFDSGLQLGRQIAEKAGAGAHVLLFYDCVAQPGVGGALHPASWLLDGVYAGLGRAEITISGAAMLCDFGLSDSWLFDGYGVATHSAAAIVLPPGVLATTNIFHGCIPVSGFYEITRIEGSVLYELDGRPAASVISDFLPPDVFNDDFRLMLNATIGQSHGDRFADYEEAAYVNRLVLSADRDTGSLQLFDADFHEGALVQIMLRDIDMVLESTRLGARRAVDELCGRQALLSLYFDCAGRAGAVSGLPVEEASIVQEIMEQSGPFCGFYSGVEIAPFRGRSRPLDWTGVLTTLSVRDP